jgi:phospholipid transport system substrate-binding protein
VLIDAFTRMTIANYAKNFDSYQRREVHRRAGIQSRVAAIISSKAALKTSTDTIAFNYRMHQVGSDWKITDVLLAGNISQMAQKRSDFAAYAGASGPEALTKRHECAYRPDARLTRLS